MKLVVVIDLADVAEPQAEAARVLETAAAAVKEAEEVKPGWSEEVKHEETNGPGLIVARVAVHADNRRVLVAEEEDAAACQFIPDLCAALKDVLEWARKLREDSQVWAELGNLFEAIKGYRPEVVEEVRHGKNNE